MKTILHQKVIFLIIALILLAENVALGFNNLQNKMPIIGLRLEHIPITGLTRSQLEKLIEREVTKRNRPLPFVYQGKIFELQRAQFGYHVDSTLLANMLLDEGRKGTPLQKFIEQQKALFGLKSQKIRGSFPQGLLTLHIFELQEAIDTDARPISIDFTADLARTTPAQNGTKIHTDKLAMLITQYIDNPPPLPIPIPTYTVFPTAHQESELDPIRKMVPDLISKPIRITSGGQIFTLSPLDLQSMLTIVERPDPKNAKISKLLVRLDDKKLNQKLGEFAATVESVTNAEFNDHDARVAIYSQFYGQKRRLIAIPTGKRLATNRVLGVQDHPGQKFIYLTFDDGPNNVYHPLILDILKAYNVKATFFLVGQNAKRENALAMRTVEEGHAIGNHSLTHSFLPNLPLSSILKELQMTDDILKPFNNNQDIKRFRPPYGGVNVSVTHTASDLGLKMYLWDVDPRDWSEPTPDELVRRIVSTAQDGSDILLHSNHLATVRALPKIIEQLQEKNFTFLTLE